MYSILLFPTYKIYGSKYGNVSSRKGLEWIYLAQNEVKGWTLLNTII